MQIINLRMHDVTHIDFRTMPDESGEDIYLNITIQSPNDSIDILVSADKHLQLSGKYNLETFLALNGIEVNRLHKAIISPDVLDEVNKGGALNGK